MELEMPHRNWRTALIDSFPPEPTNKWIVIVGQTLLGGAESLPAVAGTCCCSFASQFALPPRFVILSEVEGDLLLGISQLAEKLASCVTQSRSTDESPSVRTATSACPIKALISQNARGPIFRLHHRQQEQNPLHRNDGRSTEAHLSGQTEGLRG